jgi:hypothetical protein
MVPANQLVQDTVSLSVEPGGACLTARRGGAGRVWLSCSCALAVADGWCQHELAVLRGRMDGIADPAALKVFRQIVDGTRVQEAGAALDQAAAAFDDCLRNFDEKRPREISGRNLGRFADLITDLAACAGEFEDASGGFRRLLART